MTEIIHNTGSTQKPTQVKTAILLLYIYAVINILVDSIIKNINGNFSLVTQVVIFLVNIFLVFMISKGKIWSRNLLLIFYIFGLFASLYFLPNIKVEFVYQFIISAVRNALGLIPIIFLYLKPAKQWFETIK